MTAAEVEIVTSAAPIAHCPTIAAGVAAGFCAIAKSSYNHVIDIVGEDNIHPMFDCRLLEEPGDQFSANSTTDDCAGCGTGRKSGGTQG